MAHLRCDFYSEAIGQSTSMTVLLPQVTSTQIGMTGAATTEPPPVLYLLHGLSDDDTIWLRRTSIERYVSELGLAVVMPAVHRSFYTDEVYGQAFWTLVSQELPDLVSRFFRVSTRREDTFVAGLSMGGYGAMKLALRQPERFAAAASLSGVLDIAALWPLQRPGDPRMAQRVFGDAIPADGDLVQLAAAADPAALPALWVGCGTADHLYPGNLTFLDTCATAGIEVTTSIVPDADHEWGLWDREIAKVLDWLPLGRHAEDRTVSAD